MAKKDEIDLSLYYYKLSNLPSSFEKGGKIAGEGRRGFKSSKDSDLLCIRLVNQEEHQKYTDWLLFFIEFTQELSHPVSQSLLNCLNFSPKHAVDKLF